MKVKFSVDKIKVSGPNVDGGYNIAMWTGENEQVNIAKLMVLPQQTSYKITVEQDE